MLREALPEIVTGSVPGPKAAELIQRLESDISIDKEQYVEETYFDGTMDLDEIMENRTY